ncbi:hypothetical protein [Picosynechococcus sp. NKBG15041c]|uniref:hypothetical protein n=1 Tax=Picosynechococcus sp. NKBG15041c TaxID=1407650 RepID=UPI0003F58C39|nr:hypothetical protein [Picosynechococcus sp. NKBG15041c]
MAVSAQVVGADGKFCRGDRLRVIFHNADGRSQLLYFHGGILCRTDIWFIFPKVTLPGMTAWNYLIIS